MKKNNMTSIMVLLVFAVFTVSILMVLLSGSDIVRRIIERDQKSYNQRTAAQYLTTRAHQSDQEGAVFVRTSEQTDILVFTEVIDGTLYETSIYCYDGYLREMYCQAGLDLPLEFGEKILPMHNFEVTLDNSLLHITLEMTHGSTQTVLLHLRSWEESIA